MTMLTFSYSCNFSAYWRTKTKNNRKIAVYTISKKDENLPTDSIFKNVSHFTLLFLQATMRLRLTFDKTFSDKLEHYCGIFRDTLNYFWTLVSNEATLKNNKCTSNLNVITLWSTNYAIVFICTNSWFSTPQSCSTLKFWSYVTYIVRKNYAEELNFPKSLVTKFELFLFLLHLPYSRTGENIGIFSIQKTSNSEWDEVNVFQQQSKLLGVSWVSY